jgi:hypothetical protein
MRTSLPFILSPSKLSAFALVILATGCVRPSDSYEVALYGDGTPIDDILPEPEPMGGVIEYARLRIWGSNLGLGLVGPYSDQPRADGTSLVTGAAMFGYPADRAFDRNSTILSPGPPAGPNEDACIVRFDLGLSPGVSEYVDVGDRVAFTAADGTEIPLHRDPPRFPDPAGAAWYVGYGGLLGAVIQDHALLPDTWRNSQTMSVGFPGGFPPETSTVGAIPMPLTTATVRFPEEVADLLIDDTPLRPPHHGYNDAGVWVGDDAEDPVRFKGPWRSPLSLAWTPGESGESLTVVVRILGIGGEGDCSCAEDCGAGFSCDNWGTCVPDEGSGWVSLGEVACTVADDGEFSLTPEHMAPLLDAVPGWERAGAAMAVGRINEATVDVPDVRTAAGRRVTITPVRTRISDLTWTRLEAP